VPLHRPVVVVVEIVVVLDTVVVVDVRVVVDVPVVVVDAVDVVVGHELQNTGQIFERPGPTAAFVQNDGSVSPSHSSGSARPLQFGVVVIVEVEVVVVAVDVVV